MIDTEKKLTRLKKMLAEYGGAVIAYSGGVDSTFLAKVAHDVLQDNVLMVTACSATFPDKEMREAIALAEQLGFNYKVIWTDELTNDLFTANPPERCYYCKTELFSRLQTIAKEHNLPFILDGANFDDVADFRPGAQAAAELGVKSPLKEVELSKDEIRLLSKEYGLPTWDKPSFACLSSRFPYGEQITKEKLSMVEQAEAFLRTLGFNQLRVRQHGQMARIEVPFTDLAKVVERTDKITTQLKTLGYIYITLDLQGYRTGSMNEVLHVATE
ncbi:MAG: ATP-dependent sacrificial sulfur transferase LarE [Firmicutes bacterium]|nr:ATP-dependent sacrificial sulfur transferase LarE [Bacillota bacterium]